MLPQSVSSRKVYQLYAFSFALFCLPAWVGGFIAISIISFLSLLGVILVPLMNRVFFKFLLSFLVALAVGTLSGDAFLHLLPHVSTVIGTRILCIDMCKRLEIWFREVDFKIYLVTKSCFLY